MKGGVHFVNPDTPPFVSPQRGNIILDINIQDSAPTDYLLQSSSKNTGNTLSSCLYSDDKMVRKRKIYWLLMLETSQKNTVVKKTSNFFKTTVYLIFWIKVIPFPLSLVAESPYTRNRRSKHPMLFATLCPLLILTTTPLFGNNSV